MEKIKIQRQLSRTVGGKKYFKWAMILPKELVDKVGWQKGEEVVFETKGDLVRLRSVKMKPKK